MVNDVDIVKSAVDLGRANTKDRDPLIASELKNILAVGRETDLLETLRRVDNPNTDIFSLSKKELELYSYCVGIDPLLFETHTLPHFIDCNLIEDYGNKYEIKYQSVSDVYGYGISRVNSLVSENEKSLLEVIAKGMKKPVKEEIFDATAQNFPQYLNIGSYLDRAKILTQIPARDAIYYTSPKIFKLKREFNKVLEITEGSEIGNILDIVSNIPGIPTETITKKFSLNVISGLTISGAIEPINLTINDSTKIYAFSPEIILENNEQDHLDLVKKTLSNFRYGERYSKWNLYSIDSFLSSLLDRGYAGRATPIGTDYRNLELAGVVKVEKIAGDINGKYRFWLLKRDVIEDVQNIIKGNIPFTTNIPEINLSSMDNTVTSRMSIAASPHLNVEEVTDAIRQIQGAIFSLVILIKD